MANQKQPLKKKEYLKAIEGCSGTKVDLANILKISPSAVNQYLEKTPDVMKALEKRRLDNIDAAETEAFEQLYFQDTKNPVGAANIRQKVAFKILGTLGKERGWVERVENINQNTDTSLKNIINKVDKVRNLDKKEKEALKEVLWHGSS